MHSQTPDRFSIRHRPREPVVMWTAAEWPNPDSYPMQPLLCFNSGDRAPIPLHRHNWRLSLFASLLGLRNRPLSLRFRRTGSGIGACARMRLLVGSRFKSIPPIHERLATVNSHYMLFSLHSSHIYLITLSTPPHPMLSSYYWPLTRRWLL